MDELAAVSSCIASTARRLFATAGIGRGAELERMQESNGAIERRPSLGVARGFEVNSAELLWRWMRVFLRESEACSRQQ